MGQRVSTEIEEVVLRSFGHAERWTWKIAMKWLAVASFIIVVGLAVYMRWPDRPSEPSGIPASQLPPPPSR